MIQVRAEHVSFVYPERGIRALDDVSFTVNRGGCERIGQKYARAHFGGIFTVYAGKRID